LDFFLVYLEFFCVKFEFDWDSNSNPLFQILNQTQLFKKGKQHLGAVGRFLTVLALFQPSPRPEPAQPAHTAAASLTFSFPR
jgi:hypothetical protein